MKNTFTILLGLLIGLFWGQSLMAQTNLYTEDFSNQLGEGITGPATANLTYTSINQQWSVSTPSVSGILDANDHARVEDSVIGFNLTGLPTGLAFQFRDVDEPTRFLTSTIDISNYTTVDLILDVFEVGSLESSDSTVVAYILDGVRTVIYRAFDDYSDQDGTGSSSSTDPGNVNPVVIQPTATGLNGSTLQIEVIVDINSSSELVHIDNIIVEGTGFVPPTCSIQFTGSSASCDSTTIAVDTYTASFFYSGGGNGDYTVTSNVGTVVLVNDPDVDATGVIEVTGVPEGTDAILTFDGVNCSMLSDTLTSPSCDLLPPGPFTFVSLNFLRLNFPQLFWNTSNGAETYTIELSLDGGAFEDRGTVADTVLAFGDTVVAFGQQYTYRIRATNAAGSTLSNSLILSQPATIASLELSFACFDSANNELVWEVENPGIQEVPFTYEQPFSSQADTLLSDYRGDGIVEFRTQLNPVDTATTEDENTTIIRWLDHRLDARISSDTVLMVDLSQGCSGRTPLDTAMVVEGYHITATAIRPFFELVSVEKVVNGLEIKLGPNPFSRVLNIEARDVTGKAELSLLDLSGRQVFAESFMLNGRTSINLPNLPKGMYVLNIRTQKGVYSSKLIKR